MNACSCACIDPAGDGVHAIAVALADGDVDRALALGLLDVDACPGCSAACVAMVEAARDARRAALSARDRFRARNLRLERRAAERAALGVEGLKPYIATIGLYNTKAANVVAAARQLLERHRGEVPRDRAALEALPGVGRKTANVVLNTAFGEPAMAVDTHIFRVANRTGLAPGRNVREVEDGLLAVVPSRYLHNAHHWLILHGRYTCKARRPECPRCPIRDLCRYPAKTPGVPEPV